MGLGAPPDALATILTRDCITLYHPGRSRGAKSWRGPLAPRLVFRHS